MELYLPSAQSTQFNHKCRTCTEGKITRYSFYERVSQDVGSSKTYGELISNLLRINPSEEEEILMPQRLCIKCANLLKDIYVFLLEAEKLQEIYLNQARRSKIVIKNEDCLQELPIDLPQAHEISVDTKTEPPQTITGVGAEPQTKQEQLTENVNKEMNQSNECFRNDVILRLGNEEDAKSGLQHNAKQDSSHEVCEEPQESEVVMDIKTEPPEIIVYIGTERSETTAGIGAEPHLSKSLSSFDGLTEATKQELLTENVKKEIIQNDECSRKDIILRLRNGEDAKSGLQENGMEDSSHEVYEEGGRYSIPTSTLPNNGHISYIRSNLNMSTTCNEKFHYVLSHLLRDYPKLWHHRRGPSKDEYQKLAKKLGEELQRPVSEEKVRTVLKNVRRHLQRLEKGLSQRTHYCAYLWYAKELRYMRAVEVMSKIIEEKEFFEEKITVSAGGSEKFLEESMEIIQEDYSGPSTSAPSVQEYME
ncbi:uncharacterized protein LOC119642800 isoform X1 [Glossina fuscipes]|uniref:Uncharacterized protein LOC119642800 isoform X1 n=1 Tax=Glossina fuscipes TaxID=7396 RepID=A0A9C6DPJ7_9MUSC|nr:uncharacterized protein LOC119642800 isoform X1 [Glossina fuscipes]KAI9576103.1 hypothetical protein GQX74_014586 [Glossina fuscipes]